MLKWELLLTETKRKDLHERNREGAETRGGRTGAERDYDRILFSGPTRRLADKTQVFPLDPIDSVRTRLTHSHEVSNLARSIGMRLAFDHAVRVFGQDHRNLNVKRKVPAMLAAIGLAHDLGNPPFGHHGEQAIRDWFKKLKLPSKSKRLQDVPGDFLQFDGNPQTLRLLTRLQILNDDYGLNLTCGTLAALIKYPSWQKSKRKGGYEKFGIFESEREIINEVWNETGLQQGVRHPLTHIMEACDDMAYAVFDAEDTVKKGYASFNDLMDFLEASKDTVVQTVVKQSKAKNDDFKLESLSSGELNEISMQMFRVYAIYQMVEAVTASFISNIPDIMAGKLPKGFELMGRSEAGTLCELLKEFDRRHGFGNRAVLRLELEGHNYITSTMDMVWSAIRDDTGKPFGRYGNATISENYRRAYINSPMPIDYKDCQLLADTISGMTDSFLISTHEDMRPLFDGFSKKNTSIEF